MKIKKRNAGSPMDQPKLDYCPALRADSWDALFALTRSKYLQEKRRLVGNQYLLPFAAPPAAIARMIAHFRPDLKSAGDLNILCIGAEMVETLDGGKFTVAFLPLFLGTKTKVSLTLVGENIEFLFPTRKDTFQGIEPPAIYHMPLAQYLNQHTLQGTDLIVAFHPGFESHDGWLKDGSIRTLVASGISFFMSAYSMDDYYTDKYILETYGYSTTPQPFPNPFTFTSLEGQMAEFARWSSVLWVVDPTVPPADYLPDEKRITNMNMALNYTYKSGHLALGASGERVASDTEPSGSITHLMDRFYLTDEGTLAMMDDHGILQKSNRRLKQGLLPPYPEATDSPLERAAWAVQVLMLANDPENMEPCRTKNKRPPN